MGVLAAGSASSGETVWGTIDEDPPTYEMSQAPSDARRDRVLDRMNCRQGWVLLLLSLLVALCAGSRGSADVNPSLRARQLAGLLDAIEQGDTARAQALLKTHPSLAKVDVNGPTPLHVAVRKGNLAVARLLIARGAGVNGRDDRGVTPLLQALDAPSHRAEIMALLLTAKADTGIGNPDGDTPLHFAARSGDTGSMKLLLSRGAKPGSRDRFGYTPLHAAARSGCLDCARLLLAKGRAVVNLHPKGGYTALYYAVSRKHTDVARLLLADGADANIPGPHGVTPLHLAANYGDMDMVRLLVEKGKARVNTRAEMGLTPLGAAREQGHQAVVAYLRSHAATE